MPAQAELRVHHDIVLRGAEVGVAVKGAAEVVNELVLTQWRGTALPDDKHLLLLY